MPTIRVIKEDTIYSISAKNGEDLLSVIRRSEQFVWAPCGGSGRCGKCRIRLLNGTASPSTASELKLQEETGEKNLRLACQTTVNGDCEIALLQTDASVVENSYSPWDGDLLPHFSEGLGAAFDIGTTTVAGQLFRCESKTPIAAVGAINDQQPYGGDVISRIVHCNEHTVGPLQQLIRRQISRMLAQLCADAGVSGKEVRFLTITGNSTMMYIFCGKDPGPLAIAPFVMDTHFGECQMENLEGFPPIPCIIPYSVSAYVGSDITCSVLASGIADLPVEENTLLVDAGTNGEMVLYSGGKLYCCSTAAGPAFEGAGIDCGGNASAGAIDGVDYREGRITYSTIADQPATKLCGSGLIDAVAALLDAGMINKKGKMASECGGKFFFENSSVYISQKDIRQLQLAKAAIRAGMDALIHHCGLEYSQVNQIILCGGFGSYMHPKAAERIGLIPPGFSEKAIAIGNAAGKGASQILLSREKRTKSEEIFQRMETLELATDPYFMQRYLEAMTF